MPVTRSGLAGGPAHSTFKSGSFHFTGDSKVDFLISYRDVESAVHGKIDETTTDAMVKATGTPLEFANHAVLWPYLDMAIGSRIFGDTDSPVTWNASNGDLITIHAGAITKMPDLILGVDKDQIGEVEFTGLMKTGVEPEAANSYYTIVAAGSYTPAAVTKANIKHQRYTAAWGAISGFTAFQAQDAWTISFEVGLEPIKIQSYTRDYRLVYRKMMAKCNPLGPTMAQIDAALKLQGTGATEGRRIGTASNLVITGSGCVVTVNNAAMKTAGFVFGGKALRNGEVGFVSTLDVSDGSASACGSIATS